MANESHMTDDVDAQMTMTDELDGEPEKAVLLKKVTMMEGNADGTRSQTGSTMTIDTGSYVNEEIIDDSVTGKIKRGFRAVYKVTRSMIGLIILLILYSLLGAVIFMTIESRHEQKYKVNITSLRSEMVDELLLTSCNANNVKDAWRGKAEQMLIDYEASINDAVKNNVATPSNVEVWDFYQSLFFVGTVFTTIGYGNIAPVTTAGRLICMLYASIGIPLALLVLAELGKRFTIALKIVWAVFRRYYYTGYCRRIRKPFQDKYQLSENTTSAADTETKTVEDKSGSDRSRSGSRVVYGYEVDENFNLPIIVASAILVIYIFMGGIMYSLWEEWEFVEAMYFVFISISTIGFGDVLPKHPKFFLLSSIYIFIGLSLVSMCINVAIEYFSESIVKAKAKMSEAKHKMGAAKKKIGKKAKEVSKNAMEKANEIKTNIIDETTKVVHATEEKLRKRGASSSRESTPVNGPKPEVNGSQNGTKSSKAGSDHTFDTKHKPNGQHDEKF